MIKLRIYKSKQYKQELNNFNEQIWDNKLYDIRQKHLKFIGAQYILNKIIKIIKKHNIINIKYTESQPTVYDEENNYYWTYTGQIYININTPINSKTKRNLRYISSILNKVWGYNIIIVHKNREYRMYEKYK